MKRNILIVEQDDQFAVRLRDELVKRHCNVFIACDRQKAQAIVETRNPHLIVLGAVEPRGDAFKLHQWIKSRPSASCLPLVVVDAPLDEQRRSGWRRDEGLRLDAEEYFCRPLDPAALIPVIEELLKKTAGKIRVLVVDDHAVIREGICALLSLQKDMLIVGEAVNGLEAVGKTDQLLPHVVLMDIVMPELSGIEAAKRITGACKGVKVLVLSQYDDEANISAGVQAGAFGFIPKRSVSTGLLKAIRIARRSKYPVKYYSYR